jgi:nicotinamidase-related amidase
MELVGMKDAASKSRNVLDAFRSQGKPIFHIQHLAAKPEATFFVPGTAGAEHNESVSPKDGEAIVQKNFPNSIRLTGLETMHAITGSKTL